MRFTVTSPFKAFGTDHKKGASIALSPNQAAEFSAFVKPEEEKKSGPKSSNKTKGGK